MRILFIGAHPHALGPMPYLTDCMKYGLEQLGCQMDVVPWASHRAGEPVWKKVVQRPWDAVRICRMMRRDRFDVIFLNTSHDWRALIRDFPLVLTSRVNRLPYVFLYHGTAATKLLDPRNYMYRSVFAWRLRMAAGVFVLAREEERMLKTLWPTCHMATTRLPFLPVSQGQPQSSPQNGRNGNEPTLLYVGRLIESKGVLDLIRAFPHVLSRAPCYLKLVGGGPMANRARELAQQLGVAERVIFAGHLDRRDVWKSLHDASVFVFPSRHKEGFPVAILEALGAGLPIVCTRVGGLPDRLVENVNATFVPQGDTTALANQIVDTLTDSVLRVRMSRSNLELAQQFEPVSVMQEYFDSMKLWVQGE